MLRMLNSRCAPTAAARSASSSNSPADILFSVTEIASRLPLSRARPSIPRSKYPRMPRIRSLLSLSPSMETATSVMAEALTSLCSFFSASPLV